MSEEPQIIDLDPEHAPRMSAIILLLCGLMGIGFLLVNVVFTGEDPFHSGYWPDENEGSIQQQYNVTPNLWRGVKDQEEEDLEEGIAVNKLARKTATTNPARAFLPLNHPAYQGPAATTRPK